MSSIKQDLDTISLILVETFQTASFKRDYNSAFSKIANILSRYGLTENNRNLRFRFILFMQEFFDSIPEDQWKLKDPKFIKESENFAISKFRDWILDQIS